MKNRIVPIITTLFLILNVCTVSADTDMLNAFGITGKYEVSEPMTRIEFMKIISSVLPSIGLSTEAVKNFEDYDKIEADSDAVMAVEKLLLYGIIRGNNKNELLPDEIIDETEAVTMLVRLLGYEVKAKEDGYPDGYVKTATRIGLYKEISEKSKNEKIYALIANALDITVMEQKNWGGDASLEISDDKTLLNSMMKIYSATDTVYAIGGFALSEAYTVNDGKVRIGSYIFDASDEWQLKLKEYIGQSVMFYYKENEETGNNDIMYFKGKSSFESRMIDLRDVISIDSNVISYEKDNKTKKITTEKAPYIIYNNRPCNGIGDLSKTGRIKLLGNGGKYSVLVIEDYITMTVSSVSCFDHKIYADSSENPLLDLKEDESYAIYNEKKEKISLEDLKKNDVLSILVSRNGEFFEIYKSSESVFGKITGFNIAEFEESTFTVSGVEYGFTEEFFRNMGNPSDYLNIATDFYLDIFGNIAYMESTGETGMKIGYMIGYKPAENTFDNPEVRIFTLNSAFEDFEINTEKFIADGNEASYNTFFDSLSMPCIISYKLNREGLLTKIETALEQPRNGLYRFSQTTSGTYRTTPGGFGNNVLCSEDAKVFIVPDDSSQDLYSEDYYSVETMGIFLNTYTYSNLAFYATEENSLTSNVVVYKKSTDNYYDYDSKPAMVDKIKKALNPSGEWVDEIYVYIDGVLTSFYGKSDVNLSETNQTINGIQITKTKVDKGDIIRLGTNVMKEVGSVQMLYDCSEDRYFHSANPYTPSTTYKISFGTVNRTDGNIIEVYYENTNSYEYYNIENSPIVFYDESKSKYNIYTGNKDSFIIADNVRSPGEASKVFIFSSGNVPKCVFLY